jgi:hypothetical protein
VIVRKPGTGDRDPGTVKKALKIGNLRFEIFGLTSPYPSPQALRIEG